MLNTVLARLQWFDSDDDGVPDAGESEVDQNMPDPTMVASLFDGADTDFDAGESPSFTRSEDSAFGRNH